MIQIKRTFLLVAIILLVSMCANPVSPVGGPTDVEPPGYVKSEPPLFTKNFSSNTIRIYFDEFIELKEINNQFIVSPPMLEIPEFKIKGKSVVVEFQEELIANTTYNLFFGSAIVDITESNPVQNFQYVFTTGDVLDSLSIEGYVYNSFNLEPVENANILLYLDNNDTIVYDSLPYFIKPYFLAKTDVSGNFVINNLPDSTFKLFVLADLNSNLIYDQPLEQIAFLDSLVVPYYIPPPIADSLINDSLLSEFIPEIPEVNEFYEMALFQEEDSVQRFLKAFLGKEAQLVLIFKQPTKNSAVRPLNLDVDTTWSIVELNATKDTLIYWLNIQGPDSLQLEIIDNNVILDTAELAIVKRINKRKERKEEELKRLKVKITPKGKIDLNKPLQLKFDYPLKSYDFSNIVLIENEDTLVPEIIFTDSIFRKAVLSHKWKESASYKLIIPDSLFYNILDRTHDSIISSFNSKSLEDYGNLYIETVLKNEGMNHIIQLMQKENIVSEVIVTKSQNLAFEYLTPSLYTIKVIFDENNNGKWDTGDYHYNIQPENVEYFPNEINIRGNWDVEENWSL